MQPGDWVMAIGNPFNLAHTVSVGVISATGRSFPVAEQRTAQVLQTDAAINPGNSGGALVDGRGRLVGINTAAAQAGIAENVGFAIAIDEAMPVIDEIRNKPPGQRAWLGVALAPVDSAADAAQLGLDADVRGAVVVTVYPGSPAAAAGVREGDVIVAIDDKAVRSPSDVTRALRQLHPGATATLRLVDAFGPRQASVTLVRRPATLR
jgi:S1-C subfamily serine protease